VASDLRARRQRAQIGERKFGRTLDETAEIERPVREAFRGLLLVIVIIGLNGTVGPELRR
jgi:hypothetical protein